MSNYPLHEMKALRAASESAAAQVTVRAEKLFKCAALEAKNKEAAKTHLLQIQLLLSRSSTK